MPTSNPHLVMPPDFTSKRFHQAREQIIANSGDHDTAANQLALIWTLNNDLEKQDWDHQVWQQQLAAAECKRQEEEEWERQQQQLAATKCERQEEEEWERQQVEKEREQEAVLQEERKKYQHKHAPIPQDTVISSDPIIIPSPITVHKLHKGNFVELYYFTNKGLHNAELSMHSANDKALAPLQMRDGLHSFIPLMAAQAKGTIIR
ncbi:hypothetical protein F5141DRAFT_1211997 [Pisolithus sp. B1]|nr:hypothetical protein F5141DRAFT_1211997 [Pisolithus sp. B1]